MALLVAAGSGAVIDAPAANLVGFVVGSVLGFALLGWFSATDNRRRVPGLYRDWRIPSRLVVRASALASWTVGIAHAWFLALEVTRIV